MSKIRFDVYDYVNDIIVEQLGKIKNGDCDYLVNSQMQLPYNPISKTVYNSVNFIVLTILAEKKKYRYNAWATFNQIKKEGGVLKKGAKHEKVVFYSFLFFHKGKKISEAKYKQLLQTLPKKDLTNLDKKGYLRYYQVFNFNDIEGLDHLLAEDRNIEFQPVEKIEKASKIINLCNPVILEEKRNVACYNYTRDVIIMPLTKHFKSTEKYYATLFHELSHWTGHESRLNREMSQEIKEYAFEELIAEFSGAYLTTYCGIKSEIYNSAFYIDSWLKALENDKKFIFKAISKSKKTFDYITNFQMTA